MPQRSIAIACFIAVFAAVGAGTPYLAIYYQSLGMSLDAIGLLAAAVAACAFVAAPTWGVVSDAFAGNRLVLSLACLIAAGFAAVAALITDPLVVGLVVLALWLAFGGVGPLLDAKALETVADDQNRYSRLRAWGSASFVVSAVIVGSLIEATQVRAIFVVLVACLVAAGIVALGLKSTRTVTPLPRLSGIRAVFSNRALVSFLAAVLVAWAANSAVNAFVSVYLINMGAPASLVGVSWAIGAAVEVPLMVAFPVLARRFGSERLVLAGAAFMSARAITIAVAPDPALAALTMALHGAGFALLLVGGVTYVARNAPSGAAATAQGVLTGTVVGLSQIIGPGIGGLIAGQVGLTSLFLVAGGAGAVAVVGLALVLGLRGPQPEAAAVPKLPGELG